ncbi:probable lysine-specific demethylase JMJ16 at C-terminar half [Coccomyxa sp. Obi]|nr:probable lysine-specific demethylase JMJ16 at C-terminar half [Coccomyxa sp. Obi]
MEKENNEHRNGGIETSDGLAKMFADGNKAIATQKTEDLFKQLESRELTREELDIIQSRVALQRKMLEEYEKRERNRKIQEIQTICPDASEEEAVRALELCDQREEEAAAQLADPAFLRRVRASLGMAVPSLAPKTRSWAAKPGASRPRKIDPSHCSDEVFFGAFRGRGFTTAPAPAVRPASAGAPAPAARRAAAAAAAAVDAEEPEAACDADVQEEVEDEQMQADPTEADREPQTIPSPAPSASVQQMYGLARELSDGTVRPVTSSELKGVQEVPRSPSTAATSPAHSTRSRQKREKAAADGAARPLEAIAEQEEAQSEVPKDQAPAKKAAKSGKTGILRFLVPAAQKAKPETSPTAAQTAAAAAKEDVNGRGAKFEAEANAKAGASRQKRKSISLTEQTEVVELPEEAEEGDRKPARNMERGGSRAAAGQLPKGGAADAKGKDSDSWATHSAVDDEETETDDDFMEAKSAKAGRSAAVHRTTRRAQRATSCKVGATGGGRRRACTSAAASRAKAAAAPAEAGPAAVTEPANAGAEDTDTDVDIVNTGARSAGRAKVPAKQKAAPSKPPRRTVGAISRSGHTKAGRVRQKSHKQAEIVSVGNLRTEAGWYNSGYIFPDGFTSRVSFRSSVVLDQLCVHECTVIGRGGRFWPAPTFKVTAMDRADEPLIAKSCTGCWSAVLKRINAEIEGRRAAGEDLPPPPKTAIAGPEYFGLNQPEIMDAIEALDPEHACEDYWAGKADREAAAAGLPVPERAAAARAPGGAPRPAGAPRRRGGKRGRNGSDTDNEGSDNEEANAAGNRWSAVSRTDRYRKRCAADGDATDYIDAENPLPGFIDPITLEPVVTPAISAHGHVMGLATWKAVLAESGMCPFTKTPMRWEACTVLTHSNIERYKDRIKSN